MSDNISDNLKVFPFKQHTPLRDMYFNSLQSWAGAEIGKSAFADFYMDYSFFLLDFMGEKFVEFKDADAETTASYDKLERTDEVTLYFLPCYEVILLRDFFEKGYYVLDKDEKRFETAGNDYLKLIIDCRRRFLLIYAAAHNLPFDTLEKRFRAKWGEYENFLDPDIRHGKFWNGVQDLLVADLMENFLRTDDEQTKELMEFNIDFFFTQRISQILAGMGYYYDKIPEVLAALK